MLTFDHLVIAAQTLEEGVVHVRERLGVGIPFGGKHPLMGTHNHLMQLGDAAFLEVIAIDPGADVSRTRWYGLDRFAGPPRLIHWVARVRSMGDIEGLDADVGPPIDVTRGDLSWQLTVRDDGYFAFDGAFPSIIDWPDDGFPVPNMADLGCSMESLELVHPSASELGAALLPVLNDGRIGIKQGEIGLRAEIATPLGLRSL